MTPSQALAARRCYKWTTLIITGFDPAKLQTTCEQRSVHSRHLRRHAAGADFTVRTPTIAVRASPSIVRRHYRRNRAGLGGWRRRIDRLATVWWWRRRRWRRRKRWRSGLQCWIEVSLQVKSFEFSTSKQYGALLQPNPPYAKFSAILDYRVRHLESSFASFTTTRSRSTCTCTSMQILAKFVAWSCERLDVFLVRFAVALFGFASSLQCGW